VNPQPTQAIPVDRETAQADRETKHLKKTLGRLDIIFLIVAAVVSVEVLGQVSGFGAETFTWALVLAVFFLVPYGLIFAETGAAFTGEGGVYIWARKAFGRPVAAIASLLTWVTQPVWVGGSMAFIASEAWSSYVTPFEHGSVADYAFKLVFIWLTVLAAIISLRHGKWIPNVGAILKIVFLGVFLLTTGIYAARNGVAGLSASDFNPTVAGLLGVTPLLLFSYLGFESGNSAAGEMKNPARDVPIAIARSAGIAAAAYLLPIFAILVVLPSDEITGIGGLMEAVATVYSVYGPAAPAMLTITGVIFAIVLMTQGSAWMIISDRMQAMAAADGAFFGGFFGRFHPRLGTPGSGQPALGCGCDGLHGGRHAGHRFVRRHLRRRAEHFDLHLPAQLRHRDPRRGAAAYPVPGCAAAVPGPDRQCRVPAARWSVLRMGAARVLGGGVPRHAGAPLRPRL
jgi:glutamate:GABA antiporter